MPFLIHIYIYFLHVSSQKKRRKTKKKTRDKTKSWFFHVGGKGSTPRKISKTVLKPWKRWNSLDSTGVRGIGIKRRDGWVIRNIGKYSWSTENCSKQEEETISRWWISEKWVEYQKCSVFLKLKKKKEKKIYIYIRRCNRSWMDKAVLRICICIYRYKLLYEI